MAQTKLRKPRVSSRKIYDYCDCSEYLEKKYHYDERNYKGHRYDISSGDPTNPPYCDFWHWVCDHYNPCNGMIIYFYEDDPPPEDWQREIFMRYIEEFGKGKKGQRSVTLYCYW